MVFIVLLTSALSGKRLGKWGGDARVTTVTNGEDYWISCYGLKSRIYTYVAPVYIGLFCRDIAHAHLGMIIYIIYIQTTSTQPYWPPPRVDPYKHNVKSNRPNAESHIDS